MKRFNLFMTVFALFGSGVFLMGSAQDQQTIDATGQVGRPPMGRGPFPGSAKPGHSAGLPIRLDLRMPTGELRTDGTTIIDFIITNIGTDPIKLPSSVALFDAPFEALTLWVTSAGIQDQYAKDAGSGRSFKIEIVGISAELDGGSNDSKSFTLLAPTESIRVRASSPQLKTGTNSFTAHAVLSQITDTNRLVGTADSLAITTTLVAAKSNSR